MGAFPGFLWEMVLCFKIPFFLGHFMIVQLAEGHPGWLFSPETLWRFELPTSGSEGRYQNHRAIQAPRFQVALFAALEHTAQCLGPALVASPGCPGELVRKAYRPPPSIMGPPPESSGLLPWLILMPPSTNRQVLPTTHNN